MTLLPPIILSVMGPAAEAAEDELRDNMEKSLLAGPPLAADGAGILRIHCFDVLGT